MPRYLKIILWVFAALVLPVVIGLVVLTTFDWSYARPWVNRQVSALLDRPVEVRGNLEVDWLWSGEGELADRPAGWRGWVPWPRIVANDLIVGPPEGATGTRNIAEVQRLSGVINPWSLLNNVVQVRGLNVSSGRIFLERKEDGRNNWTFGDPEKKTDKPSKWKVDLQTVAMQDVQTQVVDPVRKIDLLFTLNTIQGDNQAAMTAGGAAPAAANQAALAQGDNPPAVAAQSEKATDKAEGEKAAGDKAAEAADKRQDAKAKDGAGKDAKDVKDVKDAKDAKDGKGDKNAKPEEEILQCDKDTNISKATVQKAKQEEKKAENAKDGKAGDGKAADNKAADSRVANAKAAGGTTADGKTSVAKGADSKAADSKAAEGKAADSKTADSKAADSKAADSKSAEEKAAEPKTPEGETAQEVAEKSDHSATDPKLERAQAEAQSPYQLAWTATGTYNEAKVSGEGQIGAILTLRDASTPFPLQGKASIGKTCVELDGTITRPQDIAALDLNMVLSGDSMSDLLPLFNLALPVTPPYRTSGHLIAQLEGDNDVWRYEDFHGAVGKSDLSGTLEYRIREPRPLLTGVVKSKQLRLQDLGPVVGADTSDVKSEAAKKKDAATPKGKVLPAPDINTDAWGRMDAVVEFTGERLLRNKDLPLDNIKAKIELKDKVLSFLPLNFGVAGGTMANTIKLDGTGEQIRAYVTTRARNLKLKRLFPGASSMKASFGELHGDAKLSGTGDSIAELMRTSNGELHAVVSRGTISHYLLEAAGLNVANMILLKLFGDEQITMNCFAADFAVKNGLASVRTMRLETDDTVVDVTGTINMRKETVDLHIYPENRTLRVFTFRSPLYARGTFKSPKVGVEPGPVAARAGAAVALGVIASPFAALIPLLNMGTDEATGCVGGKKGKSGKDDADDKQDNEKGGGKNKGDPFPDLYG